MCCAFDATSEVSETLITSCNLKSETTWRGQFSMKKVQMDTALEREPLWYKSAIIYELHVRAFHDSDGDGIGDFAGLTEKLDYLQDLGVNALWLLPFYPSPLKDDGYDISDYRQVHPSYGSVSDFKRFLKEAHRRGLRVITELVVNHTSDQHPWFERARKARKGTRARDFYVWNDSPEKYSEARIIFKDFESSNWAWDPVSKSYYWHRFYSHQPDLNFDNPAVRRALLQALDYWMKLGVDGLRLDAVPYLFEREGTHCENLPETHGFLREMRAHIDQRFEDRMLLAEANQWPEDAVAYFGQGDESHMNFHFPLMPRLFMSIRLEDRFPIIDILEQTPAIPESCQWALFLRNHDELTLEMVTEEERDYMYRVYAGDAKARINLGIRRRLAPLLAKNQRKIELMNGLLFSLPGTPVLYYGDEIGMGDNIYLGDRNGVRTPMQWSGDRNAGFSRANPQSLYLPVIIDPEYHYESVNVEAQQQNPSSLLWWMKRLIALRKRFKAFGQGDLEFLHPENRKVLAFIRTYQEETILVLANLSRFAQYVELDLSRFKGLIPLELFGRTEFPPIGELPYFITLAPHNFLWFLLDSRGSGRERIEVETGEALPVIQVTRNWEQIFRGRTIQQLEEEILPGYLKSRRWFGGKARKMRSSKIIEWLEIPFDSGKGFLVFLEAGYTEGDPETYVLTLTHATGDRAAQVMEGLRSGVVAKVQVKGRKEPGILYDCILEQEFCRRLLRFISQRQQISGRQGELVATARRSLASILRSAPDPLEPSLVKSEQSNSSIIYGQSLVLKLFRRLESGVNPDLEVGDFLTRKQFPNTPRVEGWLEYRFGRDKQMSLGILQQYVENEGDCWQYTLDSLARYYERVLASPEWEELLYDEPLSEPLSLSAEKSVPPDAIAGLLGTYLESARLLGQRTAELHLTLASEPDDPAFSPEAFNPFYRRSIYQSMRNLTGRVFLLLEQQLSGLSEDVRAEAAQVLKSKNQILETFRSVMENKVFAWRIRCHGDYHLGQVLYTGKDFVIIDFEGEPARPISERRLKRSPLQDVAGMLRSFHYAAYAALFQELERGLSSPEGASKLESAANLWNRWVSSVFLRSYLQVARSGKFLPTDQVGVSTLLHVFLLEKAIYELGYELNNRPAWLKTPVRGILHLLTTGKNDEFN